MRDTSRISRILSLLETIWRQQPDMRFNQLIPHLQDMYAERHHGYGKRNAIEKNSLGLEEKTSYLDFFSLDDKEWEEFLESVASADNDGHPETEDLDNERNPNLSLLLKSEYQIVSTHEECTHFYIDESRAERLSKLGLNNQQLYPLHYDENESEYYIVSEDGVRIYSIDCVVSVIMLRRMS